MKFFNKIVYFLITIGSNTERRKSRIDYGNMGMIVFYFIQLIGYIYSQFETKSVKYYESDYLAQIGQFSSLPFIMITIHYDPFTLIMFIGILGVIVSIYVAVILQIYFKLLEPTHIVNRFIKFYFQNFQWYFLTPFHECMVGVKTCGSLAYFEMNATLDPDKCWQQISLWLMIPSFIGQILILSTGFLSLYCFRNYEFIQGDLMRKFSVLNLITIALHMILQMCCFWKDEYSNSDIVKHVVFIQIMVVISVDTYLNLPFGFTNETIFFSQILGCSTFFEILVGIWIFSSLNDGIIFLTFTMFAPLIFALVKTYFVRYFDKECLNFCSQKPTYNSDYVLEYLCQLSNQETAQQDCFLVLKYMWVHCQRCRDALCPCRQKISKFTNGHYSINVSLIYLWVQYQFQQTLRLILDQSENYSDFEALAIKFVTFLQRYRENQVLSQKIIQDILSIYSKLPTHSYPYFFLNLTKRIQYKNKIEMEQHNRSTIQISQAQYKTLQDISLFYIYESDLVNSLAMALKSQKKLWIRNASLSFDQLLKYSEEIMMNTNKVKRNFQKFQGLRERPIADSVLILRLKFLISLICMEDFNLTLRLAIQINKEEAEQNNIKHSAFNNYQFLNSQAVSVISKVTTQTLGQINQTINDQFCNFFSFDADSKFLTTIEQLLPSKIGQIHNGLIEGFLQQGRSDRIYSTSEQFILNSDNIIEKVLICLSAIFPYKNEEYQFLIVGHLLKTTKYSRDQLDSNKKGYLLVDSDFTIFGLTKNVLDRLNFNNFLKNVEKKDLMTAQKVYSCYNILQLIPQIQTKFEQYYKLQTLQNQKRVARYDTICSKESGMLIIPKAKQQEYSYSNSLQTHKYTNKHMANVLKDLSKDSINDEQQATKHFPIEYNLSQKVLTPIINDSIKEFLYFVVEVEFQEENKGSLRPSQNVAQTPALYEILRKQTAQMNHEKPNQSNVIMSNDENENNEQIDLIIDMSQTGSRRSQSDLVNQIIKVGIQMNDNTLPNSLRTLIAHFLFQIIMFLTVIIIVSNLFAHKKAIQSDCIQQITQDLDFLDAYSESMAGSRHVIFYRDFYEIVSDTIIMKNNLILNVSKYDKIYMAWQQIQKGNIRLMNMYENYSQTVLKSSIELVNLYIINYDLKSKITQSVQSYSTYYQIMQQIFFIASSTFASSPDVYLQGKNDSYFTQISRSILYYNFFDVATNANSTLDDCKVYNQEINEYYDSIIMYYFVAIYLILLLQLVAIIMIYFRVTETIKIYYQLLNLCDQEDYTHSAQYCEQLLSIVQYDRIILRLHDFATILSLPANMFDELKKNSLKATVSVKRSKEVAIQQRQTSSLSYPLLLILLSLTQLLYVLSFQLFYTNLKYNISPINNRALLAQQMRLNFIVSANRFDLFLVKSYFSAYNHSTDSTYFTRNIQTDTMILDLLEISKEVIEEDVYRIQQLNFAELLLEDSSNFQLTQQQQQQLLGGDVCNLTGCDMQKEILFDKLYQEYLSPLFNEGIVSLHQTMVSFIQGSETLVLNDQNQVQTLQRILDDATYIIYFLWGIDVIQYQISQFSHYFIDCSFQILITLTQYNQLAIILIGTGLILFIIAFQIMFVILQFRKYQLSKQIIKFIPLTILFQKNIPKHLANFQRKNMH